MVAGKVFMRIGVVTVSPTEALANERAIATAGRCSKGVDKCNRCLQCLAAQNLHHAKRKTWAGFIFQEFLTAPGAGGADRKSSSSGVRLQSAERTAASGAARSRAVGVEDHPSMTPEGGRDARHIAVFFRRRVQGSRGRVDSSLTFDRESSSAKRRAALCERGGGGDK